MSPATKKLLTPEVLYLPVSIVASHVNVIDFLEPKKPFGILQSLGYIDFFPR